MHDGFDFWLADVEDPDGPWPPRSSTANARRRPDRAADLGRGGVLDRRRHRGAPALGAARTTRTRCSTRWPGCTPPAATSLVDGTRGWSGMFRAHGLLVPVWDLPPGTGAEALEEPAAAFAAALDEALAATLPADRRRAGGPRGSGQPSAHPPLTWRSR